MRRAVGLILLVAAAACAQERLQEIDRSLLLGPWSGDGGTFDFVIGEETILYEFDMREHPYTLEGNVLVVDFEDPVLGVQRKEILRLTAEELELRDMEFDDSPTLYRRVE